MPSRLNDGYLLVSYAFRSNVAETHTLVLLIFGITPLEEIYLRIALKGEYVRAYPVEEPPVVGDDHRTARQGAVHWLPT